MLSFLRVSYLAIRPNELSFPLTLGYIYLRYDFQNLILNPFKVLTVFPFSWIELIHLLSLFLLKILNLIRGDIFQDLL